MIPSTPAVTSSSLATSTNSGLATMKTGFSLPIPTTGTGISTTLQLKPTPTTQTLALATSIPSSNVTPTCLSSSFSLGGGLLNQLKGHVSTPAPATNLLGGLTGDKKLGNLVPTTTHNASAQQATTTSSATDWTKSITTPVSTGTSSLITNQPGSDKQVSQMTYEELETTVNKLIGKLTDNEEEFAKLARELNEWDKAINENYEKLLLLTETVKTVKSAQIKLSYDLDFIAIEHKDFESVVTACEKEVENYNFSQPSRHDVYQKAVNVDIQIRRMCEELREVIEHLNDRLRFCESDDPVMQIGRVLNAHMESLKWVDESTTQIYDYITYLSQIQEQMKKSLSQGAN